MVVFDDGEVQRTELRCFTAGSCSDVWKGILDDVPVAIKVFRGLPYVEGMKEQFWDVSTTELHYFYSNADYYPAALDEGSESVVKTATP